MRRCGLICLALSAIGFTTAVSRLIVGGENQPSEFHNLLGYAVGAFLIPYVLLITAVYLLNKARQRSSGTEKSKLGYVLLGINVVLVIGYCGIYLSSSLGHTVGIEKPVGIVDANEVSTDDFSFLIPDGWSRVPPDRTQTKVMLLAGGSHWMEADAMIKVDVGRPVDPSVDVAVEGLAEMWGGEVLKGETTLDGERALVIRSEHRGTGLQPVEGIAVFRNDRFYLIMGGMTEWHSVVDAVEEIRESWKWK
jgi:amino acid transporter